MTSAQEASEILHHSPAAPESDREPTDTPSDLISQVSQADQVVQIQSQQADISLLPPPSETSMQDYYRLQQNLLALTLAFSAVIFPTVWWAYSLNIALNYLVGAFTGVLYLRMLARSVGRIGREASSANSGGFNSGRLAILIGVLVVATQWQQLSVLPVFLGFLTYKAALIAFVLWTAVLPAKRVL